MFGDPQFAARIAQPADHQHQRHEGPGNIFPAGRHQPIQFVLQAQFADQVQCQPRSAKRSRPLDDHPRKIHLHIVRLGGVEQRRLSFRRTTPGGLLDAEPASLVEISEVGDDLLPRPLGGAHAFDQRPVCVAFAILGSVTASQVHRPRVTRHHGRLGLHYISFVSVNRQRLNANSDLEAKKIIFGRQLRKLG